MVMTFPKHFPLLRRPVTKPVKNGFSLWAKVITRFMLVLLGSVTALAACSDSKSRPRRAVARVISLTPSSTEILLALGAGDLLVGADKYSVLPRGSESTPRVGDFLTPNLEAIMSLHPDLVVLDAVQNKARGALDA